MIFLFVHHNFPAQFHKLSELLAKDPNNKVYFLSLFKRRKDLNAKGVEWLQIQNKNKDLSKITFYEQSLIFAESQNMLKKNGLSPDIIHAHANFGTMNYTKEIFPNARQTGFFEWLYSIETERQIHYIDKNPKQALSIQQRQCNILSIGALDMVDVAISATEWQKSQFPKEYHSKIQCAHNGINTEYFKPDIPQNLPENIVKLKGKEIITYTARSLEPHRGFITFYRSIPKILKERPNAHVIIVGNTEHTYSNPPPDGKTYLQLIQEEVQVDLSRVHFLPLVGYDIYKSILQMSSVHIYFTVPFTLSWSLLESMSCGCTMVVSDTPTVHEVVKHEQNALLTDFHDENKLAETVCYALKNHNNLENMRLNARKTVLEKYDEKILLPKYIKLLKG